MTDEEKRSQKRDILFEHHEAQEHLASLKVRCERLAAVLEQLADCLRREATGHPGRYRNIDLTQAISNFRATPMEEMDALLEEFRAAKLKLSNLERQKNELGLK